MCKVGRRRRGAIGLDWMGWVMDELIDRLIEILHLVL